MKFRTQYDERAREQFFTAPGSPEYPIYIADENGDPVQSGVANLYEEIQSHRESVELSTLLQRYAQGDETALNKVQGVYEDIVDSPRTFAELYERVKDAEQSFNGLPGDLRALFDNSPVAFWRSLGTPEFTKKVDEYERSKSKKAAGASGAGVDSNVSDSTGGNGGALGE